MASTSSAPDERLLAFNPGPNYEVIDLIGQMLYCSVGISLNVFGDLFRRRGLWHRMQRNTCSFTAACSHQENQPLRSLDVLLADA